jgi:hypothetical protein
MTKENAGIEKEEETFGHQIQYAQLCNVWVWQRTSIGILGKRILDMTMSLA